ncbi:Transcription elongation factor 1-like [Hondaea fermentalgiana]|uniref:Transcription elongation factor 1-like n=1 Tax=Hondaea fermentalgiana TaxID=2315210 RepID=A0A2R5GN84_9STRA|nr:Transcription elongation factor 1-like [Hondaea fermentalgiana]|eukprot:GBG31198.1 Transcription elongation factor 1-like [Hondaea fermentalgiana]
MGRRRRSQKKVTTKKRATVSKVFKCPFCSTDDAVTCKILWRRLSNRQDLTEPIDVFCEWYDACENENLDVRAEEGDEDE